MNAYDVVNTIIDDWKAAAADATGGDDSTEIKTLMDADYQVHDLPPLNLDPVLDEVPEEVRNGRKEGLVLDYEDWRRIDREEMIRGEMMGKERERMGWEEARHFVRRGDV